MNERKREKMRERKKDRQESMLFKGGVVIHGLKTESKGPTLKSLSPQLDGLIAIFHQTGRLIIMIIIITYFLNNNLGIYITHIHANQSC